MGELLEYIRLAFRNIRGNLLRTILTCLIIAFGIMALVGIQTVIGSLGNSVSDVFSPFGTNQFTITNQVNQLESNNRREKKAPPIRIEEAEQFKKLMNYPGKIGISSKHGGYLEFKTNKAKTNPNASIIGGDENYLTLNNQELSFGRNFSNNELQGGESVALISSSIKTKLFKNLKNKQILGELIFAGGVRYRIIGILKDKGQGFGGSSNIIIVPIENMVRFFGNRTKSYEIKMGVPSADALEAAMAEANGVMRVARNLKTTEANNFKIEDPSGANDKLKSILRNVRIGGLVIGIVTLFGAIIGLMNILLVSVTERIKEIGISKAIGATIFNIRLQFFLEGIIISLMGGILGILFGLIAGVIVAKLAKTVFVIPWDWVAIGFTVCFIIGLVASIYPAIKASRLNPITALRQN